VQASRLQDGSRRMVSITEITGMEGDVISMQEIFRYERLGSNPDGKIIGRFNATGVRSHYSDRFRQWGYDLPPRSTNPSAPRMTRHHGIQRSPRHLHPDLRGRRAAGRRHLSDGLRQIDQPQLAVSRRLALLEKNGNREQVLEQLRKEMSQHMNRGHPALRSSPPRRRRPTSPSRPSN
jgi:hypothetical protein